MPSVRPPAVAGAFYPRNQGELDASVQYYLAQASPPAGPAPKAIIVPHAGFIYSGPIAASAYALIRQARERITRVVILGPYHRVPVKGLAVSTATSFATPLGEVPVDRAAVDALLKRPGVEVSDAAHKAEHSLEVHLPFLQVVLDRFAIVPIVVGDASAEDVAATIETLWGGPETLIVISTDLSHYHDYETAQRLDATTRAAIERLDDSPIGYDHACGRRPVAGLLRLAKQKKLKIATLDIRNSGDTAGPRDRVVGYGAWALIDTPPAPSLARPGDPGTGKDWATRTQRLLALHGPTLLHVVAASIENGLANGQALTVNPSDYASELRVHGACFVSLHRDTRLRGCIGSTVANRILIEDAAHNGFGAAFRDPRFPPLRRDEIEGLEIEISVLGEPLSLSITDEANLLAKLRPGADGLIIQDHGRRALFLPVVWKSLSDPKVFLQHLKAKAGLAANHWSPTFKAWRFGAAEFSTQDLDPKLPLWSASRPR